MHGVNDVRQIEIHTVEPIEPESSVFEFELATEKQALTKSQQTD